MKLEVFKKLNLIRSAKGGDYLEVFLISAVSSLLTIRFYLNLTGYPTLGSGNFHIAHMLWGGLFMLAALTLLFTFLNKEAKMYAAILGGIGFGAFIDELGKFITADNNYFFEPTIALIYVVFAALFLIFRAVEKTEKLTPQEYLVNALELIKDVASSDLDREEKRLALRFLHKSDDDDQTVIALKNMVEKLDEIPSRPPNLFVKLRKRLHTLYLSVIEKTWFENLLIGFFVLSSLLGFIKAFISLPDYFSLSFAETGELVFSLVSGLLVLVGIYFLRRSRLQAYEYFKRSVLVSIFLTQFFIFLREELSSIVGLGVSVLVLITLQYMIEEEEVLIKNSE